jgi:NADH pyrophosphatase NudC (nudix superfamily)
MLQIFEAQLSNPPKVKIDNREIIEARFFTRQEVLSLELAPHLYDYFQLRRDL